MADDKVVCEELKRLKDTFDFGGMERHFGLSCVGCIRVSLHNRPSKQAEDLYPDRLPEWIEREQQTQRQLEEEQAKLSKKPAKEKAAKMIIAPEDVDSYLEGKAASGISDKELQHEIKKRKGLDDVAAREFALELLRKAGAEKKRKQEERMKKATEEGDEETLAEMKGKGGREHVTNSREYMPWAPSYGAIFPNDRFSKASNGNQKRYVAIVANLMMNADFRFEQNKTDLKFFDDKVAAEREEMNRLVLESFPLCLSKHNPMTHIPKSAADFVMRRWQWRWNKSKDCFQGNPLLTLSWRADEFEDAADVKTVTGKQLLINGKADLIKMPSLQNKCTVTSEHLDSYQSASNLAPIEYDKYLLPLCYNNRVQYAMDGTTMCHLLTAAFHGNDSQLAIPVQIHEEMQHGAMRKLIVFGKPRRFGKVCNSNLRRTYLKYLAKGAFVTHNRQQRYEQLKERRENADADTAKEESRKEMAASDSVDCVDDPLNKIMSEIGKSLPSGQTAESAGIQTTPTGKRYSIFDVGGLPVLIRGSAPMTCGAGSVLVNGRHVSLQPVDELVPNVGAMILDEEERFWNYCKTVFKQSDVHCLFRMMQQAGGVGRGAFCNAQVLQIQPLVSKQDTASKEEEERMKQLMSMRVTRLHNLFTQLSSLTAGKYLVLDKRGGELMVQQQADTLDGNAFRCSMESRIGTGRPPKPFQDVFHGIEPRVLLQWQLTTQRAPGCFVAKDSNVGGGLRRRMESNGTQKAKGKAGGKAVQGNKEMGNSEGTHKGLSRSQRRKANRKRHAQQSFNEPGPSTAEKVQHLDLDNPEAPDFLSDTDSGAHTPTSLRSVSPAHSFTFSPYRNLYKTGFTAMTSDQPSTSEAN